MRVRACVGRFAGAHPSANLPPSSHETHVVLARGDSDRPVKERRRLYLVVARAGVVVTRRARVRHGLVLRALEHVAGVPERGGGGEGSSGAT